MMTKTKYYQTRGDAELKRRKGDRIFYDEKEKAYYIKIIENPFWN